MKLMLCWTVYKQDRWCICAYCDITKGKSCVFYMLSKKKGFQQVVKIIHCRSSKIKYFYHMGTCMGASQISECVTTCCSVLSARILWAANSMPTMLWLADTFWGGSDFVFFNFRLRTLLLLAEITLIKMASLKFAGKRCVEVLRFYTSSNQRKTGGAQTGVSRSAYWELLH